MNEVPAFSSTVDRAFVSFLSIRAKTETLQNPTGTS